jgi:glycopeptide antibiotics resistance protein
MRSGTSAKTAPSGIVGDELLARWGLGVLTSSSLFVLIAALFPFDFNASNSSSIKTLVGPFYGWDDIADWINNIILFVPVGLGLASLLQKSRLGSASKIAAVLFISGGLSATVEILQLFLPSRFSAFSDIIANSLGGVAGFFGFQLGKARILAFLRTLIKGRRHYFSFNKLTASLAGYFVLACCASLILTTASSLDNWDEAFTLLIGNERTGDRPWRGSVAEVIVADTAIPPGEIARAFSHAGYWHTLGNSMLGHYELNGKGNYRDQTGKLPDLSWREPRGLDEQKGVSVANDVANLRDGDKGGVFLGPNRWLETDEPAAFMTHSIRRTSQFTLSASVAAADKRQTGPARIISLSGSPYLRNFTLGQEKSDLIVRLRTRFSGENGSSPAMVVPNVFSNTGFHRIVAVYDGRYFRVYVDKPINLYSVEMIDVAIMNPVAVFRSFFALPWNQGSILDLGSMNASIYKILYFALIFIPIGSMAGLITLDLGNRGKLRLSVVGWLVIPAIAVEGILANAGGGDMSLAGILLGLGISMISFVLCRLWASTWLFNQSADTRTHAEVATIAG